VRAVAAAFVIGVSAIFVGSLPALAAGGPTHVQKTTNWATHDTAVYVVSTLNLLRTKSGQPMSQAFARKLRVVRYDVYADNVNNNLYFIDLKRATGSLAGAFAYQMGSVKPVAILLNHRVGRVNHASDQISLAYKTDPRTLIGSFTSTLPS
jgi:hypothetical protein